MGAFESVLHGFDSKLAELAIILLDRDDNQPRFHIHFENPSAGQSILSFVFGRRWGRLLALV